MLITPWTCQGGFLLTADGVALQLAAVATISWLVTAISFWLVSFGLEKRRQLLLVLQGVLGQRP